ncbi:MAG: NAD(P)/FAD-dependent oxidoreductase [Planctomycetota bacterium]
MFGRKKHEVLVVGAGPVGSFAALALARRGVRVEVIDRAWSSGTRSYALALHADALRLLEQADALGSVLERAHRVRRVGLYEGKDRRAEMRIADLPEDHSFLAVIRQDALEAELEKQLRAAGVKIKWSHELTGLEQDGQRVRTHLDRLAKDSIGYVVQHTEWVVTKSWDEEFAFVIGADGHASRVRRTLDIASRQVVDTTDFAVFEFHTDADLGDEMRLILDDHGANVVWPLPGGYCRFSFQIPVQARDEDTREKSRELVMPGEGYGDELSVEHLRELLAARTPWFSGGIDGIRWSDFVRFEGRLADSFGHGRVWLAGDAGHMTGPAGIQSMNVGLREAWDLGNHLADILQDRATPAVLEDYGQARTREWRRLLGLEGGLRATAHTDPWIASQRHLLPSCIPASGADYARLAAQLGLEA